MSDPDQTALDHAWTAFERGSSAEARRRLADLLQTAPVPHGASLLKLALSVQRSAPPGASGRADTLAKRCLDSGDPTGAVRGWLLAADQAHGPSRRRMLDRAGAVGRVDHPGVRVALAHALAREALADRDFATARARLDAVRGDIAAVDAPIASAHRALLAELRKADPADQTLPPEEAQPRLVAVTLALAQQRDPEVVCDMVARTVHDVLDVDRACVVLGDATRHRVVAQHPHTGIPLSEATLLACLHRGEEVFVEDLSRDAGAARTGVVGLGVTSVLCVPMTHGAEVVGAIYADAADVAALALGDGAWTLRTLAAAASVAVGNARSLDEERARVQQGRELAHDLRNLLGGVVGAAQLLLESEPRDDQVELLELIDRTAATLTAQVTEALAPHPPPLARVDLAELARTAIALLAVEAEAEGKPFAIDAPATAIVLAREQDLLRACVNLLTNALKYGPRGAAIEVAVTGEPGRVALSVRDHGPGVPEADLPHVFESGFQAENAQRGHGLGLGFVKRVVEELDGTVAVANHPAGGARFRVALPAAD